MMAGAFLAVTKALSIPPGLLLALCTVESNLNAHAIHVHDGEGSSYGVCQVKLATARSIIPGLTVKQLMLPNINIYVAGHYLVKQYARYHNWDYALAAYNAGRLRLTKHGAIRNMKYVTRVKKRIKK